MTPFIHTYTVDVRGGMRCERARYPVGQGDALADRFVVTIMDGGTPVKLTGVGVVATVIRPDGLSVALKGAVQDGAACVTLDDKCYDVAGNITVTLSLEEGEMRQSVLQVTLNVTTGETDVIAETPVLNVADVLAAAKRAEAAADRAEAAGGGGSGTGLPTGGAPHQQLVTDADGNATWEDRTHYSEIMNAVVLPETVPVFSEDMGGFAIVETLTNQPIAGVNHTVVFNGVSYDCVGISVEEGGVSCVAFGNTYVIGGELTTHPFFILFIPPELAAGEGASGMCIPLDGSESVTLSIAISGEVVHKLDEKYIPDSVLSKNTNLINGNADGSMRSVNAREETEEYHLGADAFAFGYDAIARGRGSIAIGERACVDGNFDDNDAGGVAIGYGAQANRFSAAVGQYAHAGYGGLAIGQNANASGYDSFAGPLAEAKGDGSVAFGRRSVASGENQVALGYNNKEDPDGRYVLIIGNGNKETTDSQGTWEPRSNAFTVDWDGNAWFPGDVYIGGTSQDDAKKLLKATKEDVVAALGYTPAGEGSGSEGVPAYVRTEAEAVARLVNQHQSNDSIIFPFLADAHCGYYQDKANAATTLAGQLLHLIGQRAPYDFIVHGGDMANGAWDTTREMTYDQIEDYTELTSDGSRGIPAIWVPGNHDDAPYMATADRVTQKEMYTLIGRKNRASGAVCPNGCNYGYLDLESQHLRVIYLDTDDKRGWGTVQVGNGGTAPAYLNAHNVSGEQLRWLANTALDFSGKDKPAGWSIVVVSHVALDVIGTITDAVSGASHAHNTANAATVLADYVRGDSGSITHGGVTVPYDFSGLDARASVICCVHGHGHKFSSEMVGGILSIGCPNVMNGRERVSSDGKTYTKTPGTANGTSFCILTIDRENSRIYADCVGVGPDREFEYTAEVVPYTNLLPISTDASGAVYNGKGFKEDTYLSGGSDGTKAGIYASGFIPGVAGDYGNYYWYFKNVGMQAGQDSHRLCVYDGSTKALVTTVKTTAASTFVYGEDGNITRWSCNSADYPNGVYIRICCAYLGADSIITANEPIE